MPNDINVQQLIINKLTKSKYNELKNANSLEPNQLYIISDDSHYTEAEILELLRAKQNVLTAEGRLNIVDNIITVDLSDFYTINDLTPLLDNKADVDKTGNKLFFENNTIYLKDVNDNIISQVAIDAKADVHVDNKTAILNNNHEVQVIGETTKNNITKYTWIGTTQEYNEALASKLIDENTECFITDDEQNLTPIVDLRVPTKLSELANDTNFINDIELNNTKLDLEAQINNKLQDSSFVHTTGDEIINGKKEFKQDIIINNNLETGKLLHKRESDTLADGYIEFGNGKLIYGKQNVSSEIEAQSRKNIFHEGNLIAGDNISIVKENDTYKINSSGGSGTSGANKNLSNLNPKGEERFTNKANTSLDNLTLDGENRFANKANTSLDNLTPDGEKHFLGNRNITNCITEIPQDIKLELKDGVLTLKAGSKVYKPNGDFIVVTKDISIKQEGNDLMFIHLRITTNELYAGYMTGATVDSRPSQPIRFASYYNKQTNVCEYYDGNQWFEISLPIAIAYRADKIGYSRIDQVFNGFGYIGSTAYILPNIKYLVPNGRNTDGALNNINKTINEVKIFTRTWVIEGFYQNAFIRNNGNLWAQNEYYEQENLPNSEYAIWYVPSENKLYYSDVPGIPTLKSEYKIATEGICMGPYGFDGTTRINSWKIPRPFHALDYSDKSTISGWASPSNKFVNLGKPASETELIAPASGNYNLMISCTVQDKGWAQIVNRTANLTTQGIGGLVGSDLALVMKASKGDKILVKYRDMDFSKAWSKFAFIYDKGEV